MGFERTGQHTHNLHARQDDWDEVHQQLMAIQKKSLAVSDPNDADEREADEVAKKVSGGESAQIHGTGGTINRKGSGGAEATPEFQGKLAGSKGGGQSLPENVQQELGSKMGADFSNVKIHTGSEAHAMNESVNAKAFTHGQDIYFKSGNFNTESKDGKELLAHELTHTVQQDTASGHKVMRATEVDTAYKTGKQLVKMNVQELDIYTSNQVDWYAGESVTESDREIVRSVLSFIREDATLVASMGAFSTSALYDVLSKKPDAHTNLVAYSDAVIKGEPFKVIPDYTPDAACNTGAAILQISAIPDKWILKDSMDATVFAKMAAGEKESQYITKFVNYYSNVIPHPVFESGTAGDFESFIKLTDEIKPSSLDVYYNDALLKSNIRNYHRFQEKALDTLKENFSKAETVDHPKAPAERRPLIVIVHPAFDPNGAFNRDVKLTNVITSADDKLNVLLVDGRVSLDEISAKITEFATKYGKNGKIDQVMFAGHGDATGVMIAGDMVEDPEKPGHAKRQMDNINLGGESDEEIGKNKERMAVFFNSVLDNMDLTSSESAKVILFNACLTKSNKIGPKSIEGVADISNPATAQTAIKDWLNKNKDVVDFVDDLVVKKAATNTAIKPDEVKVIGAVGATTTPNLISDGKLTMSYKRVDKYVTTDDKLEYVKSGEDPIGVVRAASEIWWTGQAGGKAVDRDTLKKAMSPRTGTKATWYDTLISVAFTLMMESYPNDAVGMAQIGNIVEGLLSPYPSADYIKESRIDYKQSVFFLRPLIRVLKAAGDVIGEGVYSLVLLALEQKYKNETIESRTITEKGEKETQPEAKLRIEGLEKEETTSLISSFLGIIGFIDDFFVLNEMISFKWIMKFPGQDLVGLLLKPVKKQESAQLKFALIGVNQASPDVACIAYVKSKYADKSAFVNDKTIKGWLTGFTSIEAMGDVIFPGISEKGNANIADESGKKNKEYIIPKTMKGKAGQADAPVFETPGGPAIDKLQKDAVVFISGETIDKKYYTIEYNYPAVEGSPAVEAQPAVEDKPAVEAKAEVKAKKAHYGTAYMEQTMVVPF